MKNVHFVIPEIYGESLSYYEVLKKLTNAMNEMIENYNTIPDQIAEAVANLDASQLFSAVLNQLIDSIATDNTKSTNAVKVYKKHDLLYATFNETVNLYESLIDFKTGTETELIVGTNIREVNISELFIELRKLIDINKNNIESVRAEANENREEITTIHDDITVLENKNTEQDNEITTIHDDITALENKNAEQDDEISKISTMVTPQMYGATGDGIHDDTVALQGAINSGKPVLLPVGDYLVSGTININATTEISGYGLKSAIVLNNDIGENYLFNVADSLHVGFNNFRIYGKDHIGNAISIGLTYENTILRDMYVDGFKGCLLNLGKLDSESISENVTIENCTFNATSNNGTWNHPIVKIVNQNELRFNGNRLQFTSVNKQNNPCLHAMGVRTSTFCSNIFYGSDDCAVHLVNSNNDCYGNSFMNNIIEKCGSISGYSVKLIGSNTNKITNISFISNYIYSSSARKIRLDYINNAILQGQLYEVEMSNCNNVARIDTSSSIGYTISSDNSELIMKGEMISIYRELSLMGKTKTERGLFRYNDGNQLLINNGIYNLKMINNDLLIDSNDGALILRDSTGKAHYIRVNNNGELKVTNN